MATKDQHEAWLQKVLQYVYKKEGVKVDQAPKGQSAPSGNQPEKTSVDDDLYREKEVEPSQDKPADPSVSKKINAVNKQLMSIVSNLPKEIEPKVEPQIAKIIEFLTKVSMYIERKK